MSRTPNYADVVSGTLGRVLTQANGGKTYGTHRTFADLSEELMNDYFPEYFVQEDFTVATLVRVSDRRTEFVGVSKRNASDPKLPIRGKSLALSRAVRNLVLNRLQNKQGKTVKAAVEKFVTAVNVGVVATPKA